MSHHFRNASAEDDYVEKNIGDGDQSGETDGFLKSFEKNESEED